MSESQRRSVAEFKKRWANLVVVEQDAVAAFANPDPKEGRAIFLTLMAFLANAAKDPAVVAAAAKDGAAENPYEAVGQRIVGAAAELAFKRPRIELFEWLEACQMLYDITDLKDRVLACKFQEVHLWFERYALDLNAVDRRFLEPVDSKKRERTPIDEVMQPLRYPDGTSSTVRIEEVKSTSASHDSEDDS